MQPTLGKQKPICTGRADLLEMLKKMGPAMRELWNQGLLTWAQKKSLFRSLVEKVVLKRDNDRIALRIVWRGGDVTELTVPTTVGRFDQLTGFEQIRETIRSMAQQAHTDKQIAAHLTQAGHRSPRADKFLSSTVAGLRYQLGIHHNDCHPSPHTVEKYLRPHQLAKLLQIRAHWIYDRIRSGTIQIAKHPQYQAVLFPDEPETVRKLKSLLSGEVKTLAF